MARKKNKNPNPNTPPAGDDAKETPPENPKTDDGGGGNGNANNNGGGGGGGKKEEAPATVVLKVDMHCQGCTKRIRDSVRGFPGVEAVATDVGGGRLTVVGKVDAAKLRDRVASKTKKAVDIVTPAKTKDSAAAAAPVDKAAATAAAAAAQKDQPKPADDPKKPKLPTVATVVLKVRLHCPGCIQRIRRTILKIRGAEQVTFDPDKDQVTVKGSMDAKKLPELLTAKLKRPVEVVVAPPPKKDDKKEKNNDGGGGGDNKEKNNNKSGGGEGGGKKENAEEAKAADANKMEYYGGYGYRVEMVHAPLLFSDENPNACSVM